MGGAKEWVGGAKEWGGEGTGGKPHGSEVIPGTVRGRREVKGMKLVGNSQNVKKSDGSYLGFGYFSHKKTSPTSPGRGRQGLLQAGRGRCSATPHPTSLLLLRFF